MINAVTVFLYAFFITDRWGSRPPLLIGFSINFICLLYLSAYLGVSDLSGEGDPSSTAKCQRFRGVQDIQVWNSGFQGIWVYGLNRLKKHKLQKPKTYNSEDSLVVTHPTTNSPACGLSTAERTGSPIFHTLWSYVLFEQLEGMI
ncbi:hypothetical protein VN97_g10859 [Penicillium thymicola]|uniref:Uncharacterized protein n=1 Tax=Penicillium thymicola TaxID=293382 RepID=A0AAI9X3X0_PENTH|nr:hypothetical protein VN97_g10859 [Penicillium thymicola]